MPEHAALKSILWSQFGAAIDTLEQAIKACPDNVWSDSSKKPEWKDDGVVGYWYLVFHTIFFLDYHFTEPGTTFVPPPPFGLDELDPAGLLSDKPYTKEEVLGYLDYARAKCRNAFNAWTSGEPNLRATFSWGEVAG